jgi:5-(carboxyamino)imidazole ribonucleotide synthase
MYVCIVIVKSDLKHNRFAIKTKTKPFRKMGHATIIDDDLDLAKKKAIIVKDLIKVIA